MRALSYSRARSFDECPAKFKAEYLGPRLERQEPHLIVGSFVHECCDRYVKHLMAHHKSSDFSVMGNILEAAWNSDLRGGLPEVYKEEVRDLIEKAKELLVFENIETVIGSELRLAVDAQWAPVEYDDPRAFLRGRIDRLDMDHEGGALVVDYKTGHRLEAIEATYQTPLYAGLVKAHHPDLQAIDVSLVYLRQGIVKVGRIAGPDFERAANWIEGVARNLAAAERDQLWPARPGMACRGCPAFKDCPARIQSARIVPPVDEAQAYGLAERLVLLEREREEIREALAPWVDQFGAIDINGLTLGYSTEHRLKFDTKRVVELLERMGLRPLDFLRVDTTEIKRLGRRDQKLAEQIKGCATDASLSKFKLTRTGEDEDQ